MGDGTQIRLPGRPGPERPQAGWPDLVAVARLALRHFDEICDPRCGWLAYTGASLGLRTPSFHRCHWDWNEAPSYALLGRIAARRLTGDTGGVPIEASQRQLTLAAFHRLDGFAHRLYGRGWSELDRVVLWEQARVLLALMAWFVDSGDERLLARVRGLLGALRGASRQDGDVRLFDPPLDEESTSAAWAASSWWSR